MTDRLVHPVTGELLDPDDAGALRAALNDGEQHLTEAHYNLRQEVLSVTRARNALRTRLAEIEPWQAPARRWRSDAQNKAFLCPRCGERVEAA